MAENELRFMHDRWLEFVEMSGLARASESQQCDMRCAFYYGARAALLGPSDYVLRHPELGLGFIVSLGPAIAEELDDFNAEVERAQAAEVASVLDGIAKTEASE